MTGPCLLWLRRDLRLGDHPALAAAAAAAGDAGVVPVFVVDPRFRGADATARTEALRRALTALQDGLDGCLHLVAGDPVEVIPAMAARYGAAEVHVSADHTPYGRSRDERVTDALATSGVRWVATGSPYAVTPGRIRTGGGSPYKVFSAFRRAWYAHGWPAPADTGAHSATWIAPDPGAPGVDRLLPGTPPTGVRLPEVGELVALRRWQEFLDEDLPDYHHARDRPDLDATSRLSVQLKFGTVHPRTLLADLAALGPTDTLDPDTARSRDTFASELAWREFYADVLHHRPETAYRDVDPRWARFPWDDGPGAEESFAAWCEGRTGYPIVDAGMRQLRAEGWMHDRLRMIVASFLTKDLHLHWRLGARHFMDLLVDGDLASNQHGWQWTAGTGTDAAPYFRVFNPLTQGARFDPEGDYVRRWVPELADIPGAAVHRLRTDGHNGYPAPIVDHAEERREALDRYERAIRGQD